jgi:hypothetical protein
LSAYLLLRDGPPPDGRDGVLRVGGEERGAGRADGARDDGVGAERVLGARLVGAGRVDGELRRLSDAPTGARVLGAGRGWTSRVGPDGRADEPTVPRRSETPPLLLPRDGAGASSAMRRPRGAVTRVSRPPPGVTVRGSVSARRSSVPTGSRSGATSVIERRGGEGSR